MSTSTSYSPRGIFRDFSLLVCGDVISQVIGLVSLPIVTRLFYPSDMGIMTLVWAWVMGLSVIAGLRYESTIVIEKETTNARGLFILCVLITIVFVVTLLMVGFVFFDEAVSHLQLSESNQYLIWFIPAGFLVVGLNTTVSSWVTRNCLFGWLAISKGMSGLSTAAFKIICGISGYVSASVLLLSNWMGVVIPLFFLLPRLFKGDHRVTPFPPPKTILFNAVKYRNFPVYHSLAAMVHAVSNYFPMVLFGAFYKMEIVGFYALATTALIRPTTMISESLSKVLLQRMAHLSDRALLKEFRHVTIALAITGVLPLAAIMMAGEEIFEWVFGKEWGIAGQMAQLLAPWVFVGFTNTPATQIFIVKQYLRFLFWFNLAYGTTRILVIGLCAKQELDSLQVVSYFSLTGLVFQLFYILYADIVVRQTLRQSLGGHQGEEL